MSWQEAVRDGRLAGALLPRLWVVAGPFVLRWPLATATAGTLPSCSTALLCPAVKNAGPSLHVGSQVSKAPRAAGALLLAPLVDRLLSLLEARLGLRSRQQVGGHAYSLHMPSRCRCELLLGVEGLRCCSPRTQAFLVVLGCCLAFAAALFCGVVLAWA